MADYCVLVEVGDDLEQYEFVSASRLDDWVVGENPDGSTTRIPRERVVYVKEPPQPDIGVGAGVTQEMSGATGAGE